MHSIDSDELSNSPSAFAAVTEHLPKGNVPLIIVSNLLLKNIHSGLPSNWEQKETSVDLGGEVVDHAKGVHFRPINAAPLTPPKNSPGSKINVTLYWCKGGTYSDIILQARP